MAITASWRTFDDRLQDRHGQHADQHERCSSSISIWIGRHFRFVDLDEIGIAVRNGVPFEEPVAAVTFDDGYQDIYEHAVPILKRKGIPAAAFVVTDLIGRTSWQIHDKLYHLMAKGVRHLGRPAPRSCMAC